MKPTSNSQSQNNVVKRLSLVCVATVALLCAIVQAEGQALPFGKQTGRFMTVPAYSNGGTGGDGKHNVIKTIIGGRDTNLDTGEMWQCVEYVNRFYGWIYGMNVRIAGTDASAYFGTAKARGLMAFSNGGTVSPKVGDILCFSGHVAIVREVKPDYVMVIQQNVTNSERDGWFRFRMKTVCKSVGMSYSVSGAELGSYTCQGWLRKP